MEHGAKGYRETLEKRGVPVPAHLMPPVPLPGVMGWFEAFWELSTERRFIGGPIPWSAIDAWPTDDPETFHACIRAADAAYLAWKPESAKEPLTVEAFERLGRKD